MRRFPDKTNWKTEKFHYTCSSTPKHEGGSIYGKVTGQLPKRSKKRNTLQLHYDAKQKDIEKTEFFHSVKFVLLDSSKDNGSKYLIDFATPSERLSIQSFSVDFATTRGHSGLSSKYIKNILFHQSKPGSDTELQNTLIVFSKSPHDVMPVKKCVPNLIFPHHRWSLTSCFFFSFCRIDDGCDG